MLFYESAKCLHGRMTEFKGRYYGSIFVHYEPEDKSIWNYEIEVAHPVHPLISGLMHPTLVHIFLCFIKFLRHCALDSHLLDSSFFLSLEDVIASVPPHWMEGVVEDHGSRWVGQVQLVLIFDGPRGSFIDGIV